LNISWLGSYESESVPALGFWLFYTTHNETLSAAMCVINPASPFCRTSPEIDEDQNEVLPWYLKAPQLQQINRLAGYLPSEDPLRVRGSANITTALPL